MKEIRELIIKNLKITIIFVVFNLILALVICLATSKSINNISITLQYIGIIYFLIAGFGLMGVLRTPSKYYVSETFHRDTYNRRDGMFSFAGKMIFIGLLTAVASAIFKSI